GWMVESLQQQLRAHPQRGQRLFWLERASDAMLEALYAGCTALLAASQGEGFGLPLIEAAQKGLPLIARDLPVFREVAGEHAHYFDGFAAQDLAGAIRQWLHLHARNAHPHPQGLPWLTWAQSTAQLSRAVLDGQWQSAWQP
ncbi:MAG: glycosyltransferase, partial [Ramlibacter sp.]